jgi:hypothetical protein
MARWYDPSDGTFHAIAGSPFEQGTRRQFLPPGVNAGGHDDWVLLLEARRSP